MRSLNLLPALNALPSGPHQPLREALIALDGKCVDLEVAENVGHAVEAFLVDHNVTPELNDAFRLAYPGLAATESLQEAAARLGEGGPASLVGLVSGIKGKLAELSAVDVLEDRFGIDFELATDPTQPIWDLVGKTIDGKEVLVQVKLRGAERAGEIAQAMSESPEVGFAVGSELHAALIDKYPEFADRLVDLGMENLVVTDNVEEALETLAEVEGIGVPDGLLDWAPYFGEIALGIKLIISVVKTEKAFTAVDADQRMRLHAVRALVLFSRFGISTVMSTVGGAVGTAVFPGGGTIAGLILGIGGSIALNSMVRPHIVDLGLAMTGLDRDDLFYYDNATRIEALAASFAEAHRLLPA